VSRDAVDAVDTLAALQKLAHTLGVAPEDLAPLRAVPADDIRLLRSQIAEALFQADRPRFARIASLAQAVPVALAAKVTQHAMPPLLAARTAELVDPARAAELVNRLPDSYLADVASAMDAARAPEVIRRMPPERVARVAAELARRGEWVVIGGFVAQVSAEALAASVAVLVDAQLLHVAFVLDEKSRLDEIGGLLTDAQLDGMLAAGARDGLFVELDDLIAHLSAPRADRLAERLAGAPAAVRDAIRRGSARAAALLEDSA
jgi:hypothetical protein